MSSLNAFDLFQIENLKIYQIEVEKLRNITIDQERAMRSLLEQQEQMKHAEDKLRNETKKLRTLIDIEKENIQHVQRIHHQELVDKERKLQQTLDEKRTEIAMYWEERLLHECGRLKSELEQIHNEEKWLAMESVRKKKDEDFQKAQNEWEQKLRNCLKEVTYIPIEGKLEIIITFLGGVTEKISSGERRILQGRTGEPANKYR